MREYKANLPFLTRSVKAGCCEVVSFDPSIPVYPIAQHNSNVSNQNLSGFPNLLMMPKGCDPDLDYQDLENERL